MTLGPEAWFFEEDSSTGRSRADDAAGQTADVCAYMTQATPIEFFDHTADVGMRVRAPSRAALFERAAQGLLMVVCDPATVRRVIRRHIRLEAECVDLLLVDWLAELVFLLEAQALLIAATTVEVAAVGARFRLRASARGERVDPSRHRMRNQVKGVTYHGLAVEQGARDWVATVVLDV